YIGGGYYSGVAQSSAFTTPSSAVDAGSPGSQADTSDADGSWHIAIGGSANAGMTPSTNTTERLEVSNNTGIYESNATVADTVSHTFNWTWSSAGAGWITAMMRPVVTNVGPANLKTRNGIAKANIKTINGIDIANIKTINGIA